MRKIGKIKSFRMLDAGDKMAMVIAPLFLLAWFCFVLGVGYVAIHFITKFW